MSVRSHKTAARAILLKRDRARIVKWAAAVTNPLRVLTSLPYDDDALVRWRAIEAAGWVAASFGAASTDKVRDAIRRLLWLMNDESGGLGWHAPELIGEMLCNIPALIPEYASMLPSFLREEPFEIGTHWAIARIAQVAPSAVAASAQLVTRSLADPEPSIRAFSARFLAAVKTERTSSDLNRLRTDPGEFEYYDSDSGSLQTSTVGEFVEAMLG